MSPQSFSENDMRIIANAMLCLKSGPPEIEYAKLAEKLGMSNPRSASNAWALLKKKIAALAEGDEGVSPASTPKKAAGGRSKKVQSKETEGHDDQNVSDDEPKGKSGSPKKRSANGKAAAGSPSKKSKKVKEEEAVDSGVEDANNAMKQEHDEENAAANDYDIPV